MVRFATPDPRVQEARVQALLRLFPGIQLFTVVDAVLLSLYFWSTVSPGFLVGWTLVTTAWCWTWWKLAKRSLSTSWLVVHAVVEAALFAVFFLVAFPQASPDRALVLAAFSTGLLAAGGLSKMSVPPTAMAFLGVLGTGAALGLATAPIADVWVPELLLGGFVLALASLAVGMSQIFDARVKAEEELDRQKTLVSHLLKDFEESASEGLWETDVEGRVTLVSPRLGHLFGIDADSLVGHPLAPGSDLSPVLRRMVAFRNLVVPVESGDTRRWWSLSGKPLRNSLGAVVGWRGVGSDITGARLQELEMLRLSQHDALTGLLNRHAFRRFLDEMGASDASSEPRCLVLVDLMGFKDVNESRGHAFGDALLQAVAERLRRSVPETVVVARLDGDEFALSSSLSAMNDDVQSLLARILDHLATPYHLTEGRFEPGFRLGVSYTPEDAETPDQWLRCTNLALRHAKSRGRNQIAAYQPWMMDEFRRRNRLQEDLRGAEARGEMALVFQPLVNLRNHGVTGFEALLRWAHPTQGNVPPSIFIPLAEENETILALGLWVLEEACGEALHWPRETAVSVNVSGVQLRSGNFDADVGRVLDRLSFDPRRLILEVTESALIKDDGAASTTLEALKRRGIRLALDDFGTGYSALSYLQSFPFDKLKIDQSFVRPLGAPGPSALLESILSLAQALGLATTAEGIEDEAVRQRLADLGCEEGQGFLFSPGLAADEARRFQFHPSGVQPR